MTSLAEALVDCPSLAKTIAAKIACPCLGTSSHMKGPSGLTNRWSGRVRDKVSSSYVGVRAAQLNR